MYSRIDLYGHRNSLSTVRVHALREFVQIESSISTAV